MPIKTNFEKALAKWSSIVVDEREALLSHAIQLEYSDDGDKYRSLLQQADFDVACLPQKDEFNKENHISLAPDHKDRKFTFIDLFAGIGGFRIALQQLGGECVFSSEWDKAAKETYFQNYGEVPFGDITKSEIKSLIQDKFDVLCAGFPCQPFSNAGLKKGIEDTRGTLFYHIAEILRDHQPKAVILENVRGLISNDSGRTIQTVLRTITGMGYTCNIPQELIENGPIAKLKKECSKMVLSAKDYGVPQNRPRIFIVLWRKDTKVEEFRYPEALKSETKVGNILEKLSAEEADKYTISDRLWAGHQRRRIENAKQGKGFGYCMFNNDSAYTSTISRRYYKDGSEILIEQEGKNPRKITPREAARLQGFPEDFAIPQSNTRAYQQFGNSVAVPVVTAVAKEVVSQILEG